MNEKLTDLFSRSVERVIGKEELEEKLKSGKKLRIKYGVDVTAPFLHIGHAVNLWLMRAFQEEGHKVVFLIGDFTTKIGDPTGRVEMRPSISDAAIKKGAAEFKKQVSKILLTDKKVFEERRNSEWYSRMKTTDFITLLGRLTHARLIERDMFQERIRNKREIYMHELIYPILQGYDSVMLRSDFTIIGSDQLFNEMVGRRLQEKYSQEPQVIALTRITPGIRGGVKQSKSLGNYIGLEDSPREKFGKVMSIPDELIIPYFEIYTLKPMEEIRRTERDLKAKKVNPMLLKMELARGIACRYHAKAEVDSAETFFTKTFQEKEMPKNIPAKKIKKGEKIIQTLIKSGLTNSASEARRLIHAGAVEIDGKAISDVHHKIEKSGVIRVGKKKFLKIIFEK